MTSSSIDEALMTDHPGTSDLTGNSTTAHLTPKRRCSLNKTLPHERQYLLDHHTMDATATCVMPYKYDQLGSPRDIRLLRISPGNGSEPIFCTIDHISLENAPQYDALSYAWGDPAKDELIYVEPQNCFLSATENCFRLLRRLRNNSMITTRAIWIDAICINQEDIEEKNSQVRLMGDIYRRASRVLVYPGDLYQEDPKELEMLLQHIEKPTYERGWPRPMRIITLITRLLNQDWFHRTWVLQEVVIAQSAWVILGNSTARWEEFVSASTACLDCIKSKYSKNHDAPEAFIVGLASTISQRDEKPKLWDLFPMTRHLEATDPRDKIFALLGIVGDEPKDLPAINYSLSAEHTYILVARESIAKTRTLDILQDSPLIYEDSLRDEGVLTPTWVPNWWKSHVRNIPGATAVQIARTNLFNANANMPAFWQENVAPCSKVLTVRGIRLGYVKDSGRQFISKDSVNWPSRTELFQLCMSARELASGLSQYTQESPEEICFRTLNYHLSDKAPADLKKLSKAFWSDIRTFDAEEGGTGTTMIDKQFFSRTFLRYPIRIEGGYFGLTRDYFNGRRLVCCFAGARVPYLLLEQERWSQEERKMKTYFQIAAECYVHGVMQGEALAGKEMEDLETFELI